MSPSLAYFAPGGGLGHLNRGLALCLALRDHGVEARLITDSPFAEGLAALARCPITALNRAWWAAAARDYVAAARPSLVLADTFPLGLRGEWNEPIDRPLAHLARRLREPVPLPAGRFEFILRAEPLTAAHDALLAAAAPVIALPGPIRLAPGRLPTPIPRALAAPGLTLIVHSGPLAELAALRDAAPGPAAIISPWPEAGGLEYYPATNLYAAAARILTGAGYNSMADLLPYRDRHHAIAFPRRYDDQAARLAHFFPADADGTAPAAAAVLRWFGL